MASALDRPKNALRFGIYASDVILPWEDPAEFEALVKGVNESLRPHGVLLEEQAWEVAHILWLKRRVLRGIQIEYLSGPIGRELASSGAHSLDEIHAYLHEKGADRRAELNEAREEFKKLRARVRELTKALESEEKYYADNQVDDLRKQAVLLLKTMAELEDQRIDVNLAYHPANLERLNGILAQLDARLEKALSRYVALVEHLKLLPQDQLPIKLPSPAAPEPR